ncbi:flagellar hook-associated protein FlgL [Rhabdochromatium marinum]|uniref:flagellar hook-associated protein FlgL n=1 Tax=Rhabdochromatium marinum TaxID=48729 RepID=UPI001903EC58|nr:flagellar hook-associated protein FlgL [Rhabdochromatium marinum]MBK1647473.1 flagellar hook-associated protein 3 [Rhabdochromatium marinum]
MRISTQEMFRSGVDAMQRAQSEQNRAGLQLSTGKRILTPSDDPAATTQAAQHRDIIRSINQYQRNMDLAQPRLQQEESALAGITDQLQRVRELLIYGANDTQSTETREFMAKEIREMRDSLFDIANTKDPNNEYLFGGTKSLDTPFQIDSNGVVNYVGAVGEGSVREVAITPISTIAIGNSGADVFMDIPENDGRVSADVTRAGAPPRGSLVIEKTEVSDLGVLLLGTNATDEFEISFDNSSGTLQYRVDNITQGTNETPLTDYSAGSPVEFAGRSVLLSGTPNIGDTVTSRPAQNVSLFQTLDAIATAFETPVGGSSSRADLTNAVNRGIADIDASMDHFSTVRATIGTRLQSIEKQTNLNENHKLDLRETLSELEDLDYAEAISRYTLREVALQAAQQTYVQTNRLSLFNFL